jgi:hypothetical protein
MASAWIERRTAGEGIRYRVRYRLGGREAPRLYAGSFRTMREARTRRDRVAGELAALRVPDLSALTAAPAAAPTFKAAADAWLASRVDISEGTRTQLRTSINRAVRMLGPRPTHEITPQDVAAMIGALYAEGLRPGYLRKIVQATAMVFDYLDISPNPARAKRIVRVPYENRAELHPPTAGHVVRRP